RDGVLADGGIANHAATFRRGLLSRFELRFDERDERAVRPEYARDGGHQLREPDERRVDDDEIDRLGEVGRREILGVGALAYDDAGIVAQRLGELSVAHVDGVHLADASREQAIGESSGRGAYVDGVRRADVESQRAKRLE